MTLIRFFFRLFARPQEAHRAETDRSFTPWILYAR